MTSIGASAQPMKPMRAAQTYFLFAMLSSVVCILIALWLEVAWTDFVRSNPYRTHSESVLSMLLVPPLLALVAALGWNLIPVLVATAGVAGVVVVCLRVPWPAMVLIAALCTLLTWWMWAGSETPDGTVWEPSALLWRIATWQVPIWLPSWFLLNKYYPKYWRVPVEPWKFSD